MSRPAIHFRWRWTTKAGEVYGVEGACGRTWIERWTDERDEVTCGHCLRWPWRLYPTSRPGELHIKETV